MKEELNLYNAVLQGTFLIEANAGTGKTYNITALFARMIVEKGMSVENILVVTYTNAAVSDLKAKIYTRLCTLRDCMMSALRGETPDSDDEFANKYTEARRDSLENDLKMLKYAVRDFDQCAVFTIHGFCQRMLKEHAFSGKIAYGVELTGDSREIIRKPVYDFWRKNIYKADSNIFPSLSNLSPDDLIKFYISAQSSQSIEIIKPDKTVTQQELAESVGKTQNAFQTINDMWMTQREEIVSILDPEQPNYPLKKTSYKTETLLKTFDTLEQQTRSGEYIINKSDKDLIRLTSENIKKNCKKDCSLKHIFFEVMQKWYDSAAELNSLGERFIANLKYELYIYLQENLERHKTEKSLQSYDDLISRMRDASVENHGQNSMVASLRKKYKAALIDEFQDTDPYQYDIFSTAFDTPSHALFMIGDPKQAIYSFRGADVYAYIKAASKNENNFTLTSNYRSTPELVHAVNRLFCSENSFLINKISYSPSKDMHAEIPLMICGEREPAMTIWESEALNAHEAAAFAATHISNLLSGSANGDVTLDGVSLSPSDIAVLCRTNKEMTMVKNALAALQIPAVVSGSASVFESDEALEVANILTAVLNPFSIKNIKTALSTPLFSYPADRLYNLEEQEEWEEIENEFRQFNDTLNLRGFTPMFFGLISRKDVYRTVAGMSGGERKLTNYIHLAELAQRYEQEKKASPQDLIRWLKEKISEASQKDDESELKMDSDENAVTIITIHKSKGLEYPVVYAPFLHLGRKQAKPPYKYHIGEKYLMDITGETGEEESREEAKAEDLRIAYVALTRAKAVCYTAWGKDTGHADSAMSYIINGKYEKYKDGQLQNFCKDTKIAYKKLSGFDTSVYKPKPEPEAHANRVFTAEINSGWKLNSFSGLIHSASSGKDTDQYIRTEEEQPKQTYSIFSFPKGAKAGTCLHECMENIRFESASYADILSIVDEKLERYSFDTEYTQAVSSCLTAIIEKDIQGLKLCRLSADDYVHEMEFHIASGAFSSAEISDIFRSCGEEEFANASSTLSFDSVIGFLNGFADLIFRQGERYYVLDWKSNHLGNTSADYSQDKMYGEMLKNHYYMQLYIYTTALHMHLKKSLPDYCYDAHMGGGIYIFMRGINPSDDNGVYSHRPQREAIEQIEKLVSRYE